MFPSLRHSTILIRTKREEGREVGGDNSYDGYELVCTSPSRLSRTPNKNGMDVFAQYNAYYNPDLSHASALK